jgi:fido (protein-threonine AMPylation protein)
MQSGKGEIAACLQAMVQVRVFRIPLKRIISLLNKAGTDGKSGLQKMHRSLFGAMSFLGHVRRTKKKEQVQFKAYVNLNLKKGTSNHTHILEEAGRQNKVFRSCGDSTPNRETVISGHKHTTVCHRF